VRGSEKLVAAKKLAAENNWQAAAILWEEEVVNENPKIKAKACYNMAFYNEMNGKFEEAMEWVVMAYAHDENKYALTYMDVLRERIARNKIVEEQLQRSEITASIGLN